MKSKRPHGDGSISKRGTRYRAQVTMDGQRLSTTRATKKEAARWIDQQKGLVKDGFTLKGGKTTLREFLESWLESTASSVRKYTHRQRVYQVNDLICPHLGSVMLKDLTAAKIQELYNQLQKEGKGASVIIKMHINLHSALEHAVHLGLLPRNPSDAAILPQVPHREMQVYDEGQVAKLMLATRGTRLEALWHLAVTTGARQMELLGLKWEDIDWDNRCLTIQRQLARKDNRGEWEFVAPKTDFSRRVIQIGDEALRLLRAHERQQQYEHEFMGARWHNDYNLIFTTRVGAPIDHVDLVKRWKALTQKAGLPYIRFHDLRHTAATLMLNKGIPLIVVSRRLGHAKASTTLNVYGHLIPAYQKEAANLMNELATVVPDGTIFEKETP